MDKPRGKFTLILLSVTAAALLVSVPRSLRHALDRGEFYVFTADFFADLPKRLTGPGKFRFVLQPLVATILGVYSGRADARVGRPPYLFGVLFCRRSRPELLKTGFQQILNLVLMGILIDSICQWLILGASYPGAALIVGPILIAAPYGVARALLNRFTRSRSGSTNVGDKIG